jgi:hypothetical protein
MKVLHPKVLLIALVLAAVLAVVPSTKAFAQAQPGTTAACKLAEPPPPENPDPAKREPPYESSMRQQCEDELAKDHAWWFNLEGRLRTHIHEQTAKEVTTNNRHVVMAYAAIWIIAVGFVVLMWRKQVALRGEIERLSKELSKAEAK